METPEVLYAVGDVHGCYEQLLRAVAKIKGHAGGRSYQAYFLGDYVDRGPKSREVVNVIFELVTDGGTAGRWFALRGNHEMMFVDACNGTGEDFWLAYGGIETNRSYRGYATEMARHAEWFSSLPTMLQTENYAFVHAGCSSRYPLDAQPEEVLLWIRDWEKDDHDFGKHIVYGHTPREQPELRRFSTGLDTQAFAGGPLSVGVFDPAVCAGPLEILQAL